MDGAGEGKPVGNWEEARERVEEGSTSGVSTINSNKSPKESTVVHYLNFAVIIFFFF